MTGLRALPRRFPTRPAAPTAPPEAARHPKAAGRNCHGRGQSPAMAGSAGRLRPAMAVLSTQLERESDVFARRRERMETLVAELRERTAQMARGGGEKALERHRSRGKLTAR